MSSPRSGRAEVLKALGRFENALAAYDEVIVEHPEDVIAKTGRAEVLKALGRFENALAAYNDIVTAHPQDSIARNGRSCVLAALRRYEEAISYLPDKVPTSHEDWIGYHIRGMILLRMGQTDEALQVFEHGAIGCPWPSSRQYFLTALGAAWLRQNEFRKASEVLEQITFPMLQPQANILRLHSFGELGERDRAIAVYNDLTTNPPPSSEEIMGEFNHRYISREGPQHDDEWVYRQEVDLFLLTSNQQSLYM